MKKIITCASVMALVLGGLLTFAPAHAEEAEPTPIEPRTAIEPREGIEPRDGEDEPVPTSSPNESVTINCADSVDADGEETNCQASVVEGDTDDEPTYPEGHEAEEDEEEEDGEPVMWPVYLSLGVLGGSLILIIIINLASRKRK